MRDAEVDLKCWRCVPERLRNAIEKPLIGPLICPLANWFAESRPPMLLHGEPTPLCFQFCLHYQSEATFESIAIMFECMTSPSCNDAIVILLQPNARAKAWQ